MVDWNLPSLSTLYSSVISYFKNRDEDLATMFDGSSSTNYPTNTIRWNSANKRFEKYNGTSWVELETTYFINVDKIDGYDAGNGTGNIPINNDTLNQGLNSQKVNGIEASTTAQANKLLALNGSAKFSVDITGDAGSVGGHTESALEKIANKGQNNGYASLDSSGSVPANQLGNTTKIIFQSPVLAGTYTAFGNGFLMMRGNYGIPSTATSVLLMLQTKNGSVGSQVYSRFAVSPRYDVEQLVVALASPVQAGWLINHTQGFVQLSSGGEISHYFQGVGTNPEAKMWVLGYI